MTDARLAVISAVIAALRGAPAVMAVATGGVHSPIAPPDVAPPYIVVDAQPRAIEYTYTKVARVADEYVVKGITRGNSQLPGLQLAGQIQTVLQDAALDLAPWGWRLMALRLASHIGYPELVEGVTHYHVGGSYRIEVTGA